MIASGFIIFIILKNLCGRGSLQLGHYLINTHAAGLNFIMITYRFHGGFSSWEAYWQFA